MKNSLVVYSSLLLFTTLFSPRAILAFDKKSTLKTDSSLVKVKYFNKNALDSLKAIKEFDYLPGSRKSSPADSWIVRAWDYIADVFSSLWNSIFGPLERVPYGSTVLNYLLLALAVGLLIYVIIKAAGLDPGRLFGISSQKTNMPYGVIADNIHEIDFDDEIQKAAAGHNFRLAVRLLYLKALKQLSDVRLIKWETNKTNAAYVAELKDPHQKQTFDTLTRQFEYIWYGDFPIDNQAFVNINQLFQNFKKQVQ